jgi:hypothetical protein
VCSLVGATNGSVSIVSGGAVTVQGSQLAAGNGDLNLVGSSVSIQNGVQSSNQTTTEQRLGDGLYEQQLIAQQLTTLTGSPLIAGYTSDTAEYQALMTAGAAYERQYDLVSRGP